MSLKQVRDFHEKYAFPVGRRLDEEFSHDLISAMIQAIAVVLRDKSATLIPQSINAYKKFKDYRLQRVQLIMEEAAEVFEALAELDEVKLADGLGDLSYVTDGTAVHYDIPLPEVVDEIHRSNMTKTRNIHKDPRMKSKGPNYKPPSIADAIERGRKDG